jgi:hypothetical protein
MLGTGMVDEALRTGARLSLSTDLSHTEMSDVGRTRHMSMADVRYTAEVVQITH